MYRHLPLPRTGLRHRARRVLGSKDPARIADRVVADEYIAVSEKVEALRRCADAARRCRSERRLEARFDGRRTPVLERCR